MAKDGMKIEGIKELDKSLGLLPGKIAKRIANKALRLPARKVRDLAKTRVPVDKGPLKKSLTVKTVKLKSKTLNAAHVITDSKKAGEDVFYAQWVEYGKEGVPATSFLRDSTDEVGNSSFESDVAKVLATDIRKEFLKVAKK